MGLQLAQQKGIGPITGTIKTFYLKRSNYDSRAAIKYKRALGFDIRKSPKSIKQTEKKTRRLLVLVLLHELSRGKYPKMLGIRSSARAYKILKKSFSALTKNMLHPRLSLILILIFRGYQFKCLKLKVRLASERHIN